VIRQARPWVSALALCVVATACATQASEFPVAQQSLATDATASCENLAGELDRLAVLRREIGRERGELNAQDTANLLLNSINFPPSLLISAPLTAMGADARNRRLDTSSGAAETRMLVLSNLRSERACGPSNPERADAEPRLVAALRANPGNSADARRARAKAVEAYLSEQ
jgi:hypothetical protein